MNENEDRGAEPKLGEFPFPLNDGPRESSFLTWLRNHSNYMAARGFTDYLRTIGVLVRGIVINFLIFLPWLFLVSIALGYFHHLMLDHPFYVTRLVLGSALFWILLFAGAVPLVMINRYKRSLETGTYTTIKERDTYERTFGFLLLAVLAVAILESLPWAMELLHELVRKETYSWTGMLASLGAGLLFLSSSEKLLSVFSGLRKKIITLLFGLFGLLVPLLVILYATEYLVYGLPPLPIVLFSPLIVAVIGFGLMILAVLTGVYRRVLTAKESAGVVGLLGSGALVVVLIALLVLAARKDNQEEYGRIREIIAPVQRLALGFAEISDQEEMDPELTRSLDELAVVQREYEIVQGEVKEEVEETEEESEDLRARSMRRYVESGREYISVADDLAALHRGTLRPLRSELVDLAYAKLLENLVEEMAPNDPSQMIQDRDVRMALQVKIIEWILKDPDWGYFDPNLDKGRADSLAEGARFEANRRLKNLNVSTVELSRLVPLDILENRIKAKVEALNARRELADLTGRESLAKLLGKDDLVDLMFPVQPVFSGQSSSIRPADTVFDETMHRELAQTECIREDLPKIAKAAVKKSANPPGQTEASREAAQLAALITVLTVPSKTTSEGNPVGAAIDELAQKLYPKLSSTETLQRNLSALQSEKSNLQTAGPDRQNQEPVTKKAELETEKAELEKKRKDLEEKNADLLLVESLIKEVDEKISTLEEQQRELRSLDTKMEAVKETLARWNEIVDGITPEVLRLAREELARLAIRDLEAKHLGMVARHGARFYSSDADDELRKELEGVKGFDQRRLTEVRELAKPAEALDIRALVRLGFEGEETTGGNRLQDRRKALPNVYRVLLAAKLARAIKPNHEGDEAVTQLFRERLVEIALSDDHGNVTLDQAERALAELGQLCQWSESTGPALPFTAEELARLSVLQFTHRDLPAAEKLATTLIFGEYGPMERGSLASVQGELTAAVFNEKALFLFLVALLLLQMCRLTVDVNQTSVHGLYRDRLASAFLIGVDNEGDIGIEEDLDLNEICHYEARSNAPYHLINVALNLHGSKNPNIRDRNSDFFVFSKRFIGGERTGYCRSETMEDAFPQMSLATAMAISAAAASPNRGRSTSPLMVAFMTLLNIRLGFWLPHPGLLEEQQNTERWGRRTRRLKGLDEPGSDAVSSKEKTKGATGSDPLGFTFEEVFARELEDIQRRRVQIDSENGKQSDHDRPEGEQEQAPSSATTPLENPLVGIAFSGGGIRSATINLGIAQALHRAGVFKFCDYMSTVSGGGYLGSSISALMRNREKLYSEIAGIVRVQQRFSEVSGKVQVHKDEDGDQIVVVTPEQEEEDGNQEAWVKSRKQRKEKYRFTGDTKLAVRSKDQIKRGQALIDEDFTDQIVTVESVEGEGGESSKIRHRFTKDAILNVTDKESVPAGKLLLKSRRVEGVTDIAGTVSVEKRGGDVIVVKVQSSSKRNLHRRYEFSKFEELVVKTGDLVEEGSPLIKPQNTFGRRFSWRVRWTAFLREMISKLDETWRWVNLSDGGHIENLATIELLRRRCRYIIIGDCEADADLSFHGLATLIRTARIDLGVEIKINLDAVRLTRSSGGEEKPNLSKEHWAIGTIHYPARSQANGEIKEEEKGLLLYLKSSCTGDEEEVIQEYRRRNRTFPHESTADQMFDEGQFEAYRALGQHIATDALKAADPKAKYGEHYDRDQCVLPEIKKFNDLDKWFKALAGKATGDSG